MMILIHADYLCVILFMLIVYKMKIRMDIFLFFCFKFLSISFN